MNAWGCMTDQAGPSIRVLDGPEGFLLSPETLARLVDPKNIVELDKLGRAEGIAQALHVDLSSGLGKTDQQEALRSVYGVNVLPHPDPPSFLWFLWNAYQDKTLVVLTIAAIVSLGIGIYTDIKNGTRKHWIEGAAIMIAVVLVVFVNAINDFQKDRQFRKLSARNEDRQVRVFRNGVKCQISIFDLCVGDIVLLDPGVHFPMYTLLCFRMCCLRMESLWRAMGFAVMSLE